MNTPMRDLVVRTFAALEAKDLAAATSLFADDAVLIDPHFPTPRMQGKAAITEGLRGAIEGMRSFGYTTVNYCESKNGQCAAVETATHHVIKHGMKRDFPQVFIFEAGDGRITRFKRTNRTGRMGSWACFCSWRASSGKFLEVDGYARGKLPCLSQKPLLRDNQVLLLHGLEV